MNKDFTDDPDDDDQEELETLSVSQKNYMTPPGFAALKSEFTKLLYEERPKVVEIVS